MSDSGKIEFSRKPYKVTYRDLEGNMQTIRRVPPPKLHDMLPKDIVKIESKKNDDWNKGDEFAIKGINPRQPNTVQLQKENGDYTFMSFYDLSLEERIGSRKYANPADDPVLNEYLIWP